MMKKRRRRKIPPDDMAMYLGNREKRR